VYYCSIPGRFKIHSFRRRRRNRSDQKLVQWSGFDCDLRLQQCFGFCSSGQTMVHTSKKAFEWTSDLQDLQADKRPTDASELAKPCFKSHVREEPRKQKPQSCRAQDWPEAVPRKMRGRKRVACRTQKDPGGTVPEGRKSEGRFEDTCFFKSLALVRSK
jgi:hypothetical protein